MSFFNKNLSVLKLKQPKLASILEHVTPVQTNTLSSFHPATYQTQLMQLQKHKVKQVILLGIGSANALPHLLSALNPLNLLIIEPKPEHLAAVFHRQDITNILHNPNVFFLLGDTIQHLQHGMQPVKTSLAAHGYHLLVNPEGYQETDSPIQIISQTVQQIIQEETLYLRMRLSRADMCQLNLIQNLPAVISSYLFDEYKNLCDGFSALIIAAGPSLDQSIADIQQIKDRVIIIAVDTALRTLLKNNINPHVVVTTDPTRNNSKHFDGTAMPASTLTAFSPDCHYAILQQLARHPHKTALLDDSTHLTYWLQKTVGFQTVCRRALNVSEAAVRFALHLGCSRILFTGLDLAIPVHGGNTHTADASHSFVILKKNADQILIQKKDGEEEWQPVVQVEGWNGETIYSYPSFKMYLHELEDIMVQHPIHWIDCTMYGAKKQGCQRMSLIDAIHQYGCQPHETKTLTAHLLNRNKIHAEPCIQALKKGIEQLSLFYQDFQTIQQGGLELPESGEIWNRFLHEETSRALLDHAVFRFQLNEPLHRIPQSQFKEAILQYTSNAANVIQQYLPLLNHAVMQIERSMNQ